MRSTIDIEDPMLRELTQRQQHAHKPLSRLVAVLLAQTLAMHRAGPPPLTCEWTSQPMGARIDLRDRYALRDALDASTAP